MLFQQQRQKGHTAAKKADRPADDAGVGAETRRQREAQRPARRGLFPQAQGLPQHHRRQIHQSRVLVIVMPLREQTGAAQGQQRRRRGQRAGEAHPAADGVQGVQPQRKQGPRPDAPPVGELLVGHVRVAGQRRKGIVSRAVVIHFDALRQRNDPHGLERLMKARLKGQELTVFHQGHAVNVDLALFIPVTAVIVYCAQPQQEDQRKQKRDHRLGKPLPGLGPQSAADCFTHSPFSFFHARSRSMRISVRP